MKKLFVALLVCCASISANAQFTEGTKYIGTSLTNLGLSYNTKSDFRFGVSAEAGYFFADNCQLFDPLEPRILPGLRLSLKHAVFSEDTCLRQCFRILYRFYLIAFIGVYQHIRLLLLRNVATLEHYSGQCIYIDSESDSR